MIYTDVHKLGGFSVANPEMFLHSANVISHHSPKDKIIVVSAIAKATDHLIAIRNAIELGNLQLRDELCHQFVDRHLSIAHELGLNGEIGPHLTYMSQVVESQPLGKPIDSQNKDLIDSMGEPLSATLLTETLKAQGVAAVTIDSASLLLATGEFGNGHVLLDQCVDKIRTTLEAQLQEGIVPVVTGFYGGSKEGARKLLGRSATDYSAALIAAAMESDGVYMWKDVNGIGHENPNAHPDTTIYSYLPYSQASDIALGAQVLHYRTMEPVAALGIPIYIKNILNPSIEGTRIGPER